MRNESASVNRAISLNDRTRPHIVARQDKRFPFHRRGLCLFAALFFLTGEGIVPVSLRSVYDLGQIFTNLVFIELMHYIFREARFIVL